MLRRSEMSGAIIDVLYVSGCISYVVMAVWFFTRNERDGL